MGRLSAEFGLDNTQVNEAIKTTDALVKKLAASFQDLDKQIRASSGGRYGLFGETKDIENSTLAMGRYGKETSKATQFLKQQRTEQRLQNFLFRELTNTLMMSVFILSAFSDEQTKAGRENKKLMESIMMTIMAFNSVDFAIKGVATALGMSVGGLGAAIAGIISLGVGLIAFFRNTDEAATKAAEEGLKKFSERFAELSKTGQKLSLEAIDKRIAQLEAEKIDKRIARLNAEKMGYTNSLDLLQKKQFDYYTTTADAVKTIDKGTTKLLKEREESIDKELEILRKLRAEAVENARVEKIKNDILAEGEKYLDAGLTTVQRLKNEQKKLNEEIETGIDKETGLALTAEQLQQHVDRQYQIQKELKSLMMSTEEKQRIYNEAVKKHNEEAQAELKWQIDTINQEFEYLHNLYELGEISYKEMINEAYELAKLLPEGSKEQIALLMKIHQLEEQNAQKIKRNEQEYLNSIKRGLMELDDGLTQLGIKSDSLVSKLLIAVQYIMQISQILSQESEKQGIGEYLSIFGNIIGLFGLLPIKFDTGGYTGTGAKYEPAGIVHKGEYVFDKQTVDKIGVMFFQSLHAKLKGYDVGGIVTAPSLIGSNIPIIINLQIKGTMDGQRFLIANMPKYVRYINKKTV